MADLEQVLDRARDTGATTVTIDPDDLECVLVVVQAGRRYVDDPSWRNLDLLTMAVSMYEVGVEGVC
jgi:hypothetical protein